MTCPECNQLIPAEVTACPACGTSIEDATRRLEPRERPAPKTVRPTSLESIDDSRFIPGTIIAERYRIVGLLGKGGMGEVYRADDLKLSQPVALKFLPESYLRDGAALARFHREVRVARQVSHRNVCRVYDIGEVDGQHFLSMEFIKGEELSSLLRRIGRLPTDKAVQIARQICAGLAAAHESGVLHRDLKPSNVMIDGEGNARITDFGLAGLATEIHEDEIGSGTPAYMAPEQLEGKSVTTRSDIYSLGLVLYELFTGKRAFEAPTFNELMRLRRSDTTPTTPTAIVKDLDPVIERVIDRCIAKDPSLRPASAIQVAAALPGGDPLAAALAAGETPSPEMVAAAPREGALKPIAAVACLLGVLACLLFLILSSGAVRIHRNVPLEKPPEVLAERSREILRALGYTEAPFDSAHGFAIDLTYARYLQDNQFVNWGRIKSGQPTVLYFWYRQSPWYLVPVSGTAVSDSDPAPTLPGMTQVYLDVRGRLVGLEHVPAQVMTTSSSTTAVDNKSAARVLTDWSALFASAGINSANLKPTEPRWVPPMYADERAAWEGPHQDHPDVNVRIEAAAFNNRPVHFSVIFPWDKPVLQRRDFLTRGERAAAIMLAAVFLGVLVGAALLGRRNLRLGRSDKKGAFRLALFIFAAGTIGALIGARHVPVLSEELGLVYHIAAFALFSAALIWLLYIALEPHVRRRWPKLIISWSRLMTGGFRDPMVGRDLLIGGLLGLVHTSIISLGMALPLWLGLEGRPGLFAQPFGFVGIRSLLWYFLVGHVVLSIFIGFAFLFVLLLLLILLRNQILATVGLFLVAFTIEALAFASSGPKYYLAASVLISVLIVITVSRFGLLATMTFQLFFFLTMAYPLTSDFSVWYSEAVVFPLAIVLALAIYGFYTSLGGQPVFKGSLLKE